MQVIVYQNGIGVNVVYPIEDLALVIAKDVPEGRAWRLMNAADLPPRTSRPLWRWTESGPLAVGP